MVVRTVAYHIQPQHEVAMHHFVSDFLHDEAHRVGLKFFAYAQTKTVPHTTLFVEAFDTQEHHDDYVREVRFTGHEEMLLHPEGKPVYETSSEILQLMHAEHKERNILISRVWLDMARCAAAVYLSREQHPWSENIVRLRPELRKRCTKLFIVVLMEHKKGSEAAYATSPTFKF